MGTSYSGHSEPDSANVLTLAKEPDYWERQGRGEAARAVFFLKAIREFETLLLRLDEQGLLHGPLHSSIGQEAVAVGATLALRRGDKVNSTHRAHHHFLAKALAWYAPADFDPTNATATEPIRTCLRRTLAEILGLSPGWAGGRGGSMHLYDRESGNLGTQAIVGGGIPIAAGFAFAEKFRETGNVALCYFGEGAVSIGSFLEGINLAVVYRLPAIFVIENNLYAVSTSNIETAGFENLVSRAAGFQIPGLALDGMDVEDMKRGVEWSREFALSGKGPVLIEAKTYRFCHQNGPRPGSAFGYRTKEEEQSWLDRDPLINLPRRLQDQEVLNASQLKSIDVLVNELVQDALNFVARTDGEKRYVLKPELWPAPEAAAIGVRSDGAEFDGAVYRELDEFPEQRELKMVQAISAVIARRMETDPEVFIIGEDIAHLGGGPYGATKEALARFPQRVFGTPISEAGFTGLGHGAAMSGLKPIVEIMFPDFALVAADQLFNQIATARHMYGGKVDVPLVVRTRSSTGRGFGAQHSGDYAGVYALYPGWRIVAPSTPFDYVGLFNSAMRSADPVVVLEHHALYPLAGPVPAEDMDYLLPLDRAILRRRGRHVTVATYLSIVPRVLAIAEQLAREEAIEVEVIDLRILDHANMDFQTIGESLRRTHALVVAEQAPAGQSLGPFIAAEVMRRFFDELDHPVVLVSSRDIPRPVSKTMESYCLVSDEEIRNSILAAARRAE